MGRRALISLLLAALNLAGCGAGAPPARPELPLSVAPGWTRKSWERSSPPPGIPTPVAAECWKADYAITGTAEVWVCGYAQEASAFDAMQRARAEADTVKFQAGRYLAIVKWAGVSRAEIFALVRAVQKALGK